MKNSIKRPMYTTEGFVDGILKQFPDATAGNDRVKSAKRGAEHFLKGTGKILNKIENARQANAADPTQTNEAKAVNTWNYAKSKRDEIDQLYQHSGNPGQVAQFLNSQIENAITDSAKNDRFAEEARKKIASMPEDKRAKFVSDAMQAGDLETARWVFGARPYFSGLSPAAHQKLKNQYKNMVYGDEVETIKNLEKLQVTIEKGYKATRQTIARVRSSAANGDAISKAEAARKAMEQ